MAWYPARGGGIPASVKTDMNSVLNKKFGTSGQTYPPKEWAEDVNLMGLLPIRTASGSVAHFEDGADSVPMKSVVANIVPIQEGTGTPSPSNPRPISGTSVLNVEQRGVNLFDEDLEEGWLNQTTGEPQEYSNRMRSKNFCSIVPNQTYYIKCGNNEEAYWYFYDSNKIYLRRRLIRNTTTTTQADECFFKVGIVGISSYSDDISLNYPSTATTYEPYTGSTYTIALGQTVYGGTADVVGGSGTLDLKYLEIDGTEASLALDSAPNVVRLTLSDLPSSNVSSQDYRYWGSESIYKYAATSNLNNNEVTMRTSGYLYYKNTNCTTLSDFQTFFATQKANGTPFTVCYELATPTEYTFTGQPINSYLGVNNVWTEAEETAVEYRADIDLLLASLEGNRGLQMTRTTPTEETQQTEEETENEDQR